MANLKEKLRDRADQADSKGLGWILILLFLVLMSLAVLYFSGNTNYQDTTAAATNSHQNSRAPRTYSVFYGGGVFSPTNLRVHSGDTVRFTNDNSVPIWIVSDPHPAHTDLLGLNSGDIMPKGTFSYTFSAPGIFNYHNEKNPNETGVIIVR